MRLPSYKVDRMSADCKAFCALMHVAGCIATASPARDKRVDAKVRRVVLVNHEPERLPAALVESHGELRWSFCTGAPTAGNIHCGPLPKPQTPGSLPTPRCAKLIYICFHGFEVKVFLEK